MAAIEHLEEMKDYFHPRTLIFTDDAEHFGIDERLIHLGFRFAGGSNESKMWYFARGETDLIRYHPTTPDVPSSQKMIEEGLITRVDFKFGDKSLIYDVCKALLDADFRVAVPNKSSYLEYFSLFKKQGDLYLREKVVELSPKN